LSQFALTYILYLGFTHLLEHNEVVGRFLTVDSLSCGAVDGKNVLWDSFMQVWYWYGTSYIFLWIDFYHDKVNKLADCRIWNPGRNPLLHVDWTMVQYGYELSFWNMLLGLGMWLIPYRLLFDKVGACEADNIWFDTFLNSLYFYFSRMRSLIALIDYVMKARGFIPKYTRNITHGMIAMHAYRSRAILLNMRW